MFFAIKIVFYAQIIYRLVFCSNSYILFQKKSPCTSARAVILRISLFFEPTYAKGNGAMLTKNATPEEVVPWSNAKMSFIVTLPPLFYAKKKNFRPCKSAKANKTSYNFSTVIPSSIDVS